MTARRLGYHLFIILCTCLVWPSLHAVVNAQEGSIAVISSADVTTLSSQEIRALFSLKQRLLQDNKPARLLVLPTSNPVSENFAKGVFDIYPYQLQRLWDRQVFSGRGKAPEVWKTELELLEELASSEAAIGYVKWDADVLKEYEGKVNVLAVY